MAEVIITRRDSRRPAIHLDFTYTGEYRYQESDVGWELRLLTSGTLTFLTPVREIDAFLVGGGGAGGSSGTSTDYSYEQEKDVTYAVCGGGGGGGYAMTARKIRTLSSKPIVFDVVVGAGGKSRTWRGEDGEGSSIFCKAISYGVGVLGGLGGGGPKGDGEGDYLWLDGIPGNGGSAGGGGAEYFPYGKNVKYTSVPAGGSDGGNSDGYLSFTYTETDGSTCEGASGHRGKGQQRTTRAFEEADGELFSGGGGGSSKELVGAGGLGGGGAGGLTNGVDGTPNTGGGGGGAASGMGGNGGSGIVILRNSPRN